MIGIVVLAATALVAAFAISTYAAWWTIWLVVFGAIVLAAERSSLPRKAAILTAGGLSGSIVLAAAGAWFVLLGAYSGARPCDECSDNRILWLPGLALVIVAIVIGILCGRSLAGGFRSTARSSSKRDDARPT